MRMMTFVVPLLKYSNAVRDYFIETLRKAMYQSDLSTRQAAVHGFCVILKELRNNNSCRSGAGLGGSQFNISGYSLMSQQLVSTPNNPQRHFDMCVLEIIGILRKCFNQTYEIKKMLYDGLTNAVELNAKLTPHILLFLESHFRDYICILDSQVRIKFEKCIAEKCVDGIPTVQIWDHFGKLLQLIGRCIIKCDENSLDFETGDLKELFDSVIDRVDTIKLEQLGLVSVGQRVSSTQMGNQLLHLQAAGGPLNYQMSQIGVQYLNCLEGLMYYEVTQSLITEKSLTTIIRLYEIHAKNSEKLLVSSLRKLCVCVTNTLIHAKLTYSAESFDEQQKIRQEEVGRGRQ